MSAYKTGGPAFPTLFLEPEFGSGNCGMTLRDYFAGQALTGILNSNNPKSTIEGMATYSYAIADAMVRERNCEP